MKIKPPRTLSQLHSHRSGLILFAGLCLATLMFVAGSPGTAYPFNKRAVVPAGTVELSGKLSQRTLVQGESSTVYLDVTLQPPARTDRLAKQQAADWVVVLDRSGSMSGAKKMKFAKAAIRNLLSRLNANDRFALVSFANDALVHSPLVEVNAGQRKRLQRLVGSIRPSGGTNMGDGLSAATRLVGNETAGRARKVVLLSDGQANQGVTEPQSLAQMATRLTQYGTVVSSIGLGLDFNETLMTTIADHGMGHYAYLEDLSNLETQLAVDLDETRNLYASGSVLEFTPGDAVQIVDAGGYPVTRGNAATVTIATGQLLANTQKRFVVTLQVAPQKPGALALGPVNLLYQKEGQTYRVSMDPEPLRLAVVEPERRPEAIGSIDRKIFEHSWLKNNLGRMQKRVSQWLREGKKVKAENAIADYRDAIRLAEKESRVPLASAEMDDTLSTMEQAVEEAFSGTRLDQAVKRKRSAKSMQYGGINQQRTPQ